MMVARVAQSLPLEPIKVPVTKRALVIGGGVAGIQAALDVADGGVETILVERSCPGVTAEDVMRAAADHLDEENFLTLTIRPSGGMLGVAWRVLRKRLFG